MKCWCFVFACTRPECRHRQERVPTARTSGRLPGGTGQVWWSEPRPETTGTGPDKYVPSFLSGVISEDGGSTLSCALSRRGAEPQHLSWRAVWNNLHVVILSCGFVWKPPPACVTLSLWFSEVPTDRTSAQSGNIFTQTPPLLLSQFTTLASHPWPQPLRECLYLGRKACFLWPDLRWNKRFPFLIPPACFPLSLSVPIWHHQACQPHKPDESRRGRRLLLHVCHYEWLHCFIPLCFCPHFSLRQKCVCSETSRSLAADTGPGASQTQLLILPPIRSPVFVPLCPCRQRRETVAPNLCNLQTSSILHGPKAEILKLLDCITLAPVWPPDVCHR